VGSFPGVGEAGTRSNTGPRKVADAMNVGSSGHGSAAGIASRRIRQELMSGRLRPDDPVYEEEWANRLGLSRTPVREAIQELVARGVLTRRGRTAYVFRPSLPGLLEIYDIRLPLERLAASRCAEAASDELVGKLEQRFEKIRDHRADSGWYTDHEAFHMEIFQGCGMPRLLDLVESLRSQSEPYVRFAVYVDQRFRDDSALQHNALMEAIRARDADRAAAVVEEHLLTTRRKLADLMQFSPDGFEALARMLRP
jgi:DNA-binding GntR family transcriptional regulator